MSAVLREEAAVSRQPADPLWFKDAVIYQLHVKSFFDANDDGIGDLPGLIAKLDYIAGLGVNTLWLLPFYPSPRRDDGYDISDYTDVHPDYGTLDDARRFIDAAHERGLRVITELVVNHTSDQHPWFQRARRAPRASPERAWYVWSDTDEAYAGTRIIFCDTERSNWTWDAEAGQYFWHRFYSHQPDLNYDNPAVIEEVLRALRFWLDLGVDGLRLDAVPYLVEREGTSNENLPETHAVLRHIRRVIDDEYPDRLLLAEANMWPEDVQEYFGAGDECHMAFHFPLMPRMYMAIAREDRFPITDILRQTPDIPDNCQWAIFLRNHDELTLEMVTDSERDYLWETYAADRRARINLGIRRRLAPLLERDRRRIELMSSLLLTLPGTPVLYYGDEIGMGDNIHLGDRDGVRTPMQWSIDRNGGFSRADPATLVLPPLMDPLYGFQTVNVEAQQRDMHSLLNWTRRMLEMRRRYRAFGRGTLKLLYPGNRRVLAYLRQIDDETILCVANLSRSHQAVELDLSSYEDHVPVELLGGTSFPPIGQLTYLLTLPPYGFYGFQLVARAHLPDWHEPAPQPMPEYRTLVLRRPLDASLQHDGALRATLERDILPEWLPRRRWYPGDVSPQQVSLLHATALDDGGDLLLAELRTDEGTHCFVPLGIAWEREDLPALPQRLALSRVRRGREVGFLTDAHALPPFARALLRHLREVHPLQSAAGTIRFVGSQALADIDLGDEADVRWLNVEQSNSSVIVGNAVVIKLLRRLVPGVQIEAEMGRRLTELGYPNVAPLLGEVVRDGDDGPVTLAVAIGYVANRGDAWRWTLDLLARLSDAAQAADADAHADTGIDDLLADYEAFMHVSGTRLAELHAALSLPTDDEAFAPQPVDDGSAQAWSDAAMAQLDAALEALDRVDDATLASARQALAARHDALHGRVTDAARSARGALATRVHGDFHLGQVLVAPDDVYLIDFEGEPVRPLHERRAKASPLRDVAGLLRSLRYATAVFVRGEDSIAPAGVAALEPLLPRFEAAAARAFLDAYRAVLEATPHPWVAPSSLDALLPLFLIEKAAYEVRYEAAHRPHWIDIPAQALLRLADGAPGMDGIADDARQP